jgi:hypothetical protein
MLMRCRLHFMTLVSLCSISLALVVSHPAWAAKEDPSPDFSEEADPNAEAVNADSKSKMDSVEIAKPPPFSPRETQTEYFFPYTRSMSARFGGVYDSKQFGDKGVVYIAGISLLYRYKQKYFFDFGFDLRSDSTGNLYGERRWIYSRSRFRPYTKAGMGLNLIPSDQLVTFLRFKNYQVRGAIGAEQIFISPMSFRYELELLQSDVTAIILCLGYSWAW